MPQGGRREGKIIKGEVTMTRMRMRRIIIEEDTGAEGGTKMIEGGEGTMTQEVLTPYDCTKETLRSIKWYENTPRPRKC